MFVLLGQVHPHLDGHPVLGVRVALPRASPPSALGRHRGPLRPGRVRERLHTLPRRLHATRLLHGEYTSERSVHLPATASTIWCGIVTTCNFTIVN